MNILYLYLIALALQIYEIISIQWHFCDTFMILFCKLFRKVSFPYNPCVQGLMQADAPGMILWHFWLKKLIRVRASKPYGSKTTLSWFCSPQKASQLYNFVSFTQKKNNPVVVFSRKISYLCKRNGNSHNYDKKNKICQYKVKLPSKTDL